MAGGISLLSCLRKGPNRPLKSFPCRDRCGGGRQEQMNCHRPGDPECRLLGIGVFLKASGHTWFLYTVCWVFCRAGVPSQDPVLGTLEHCGVMGSCLLLEVWIIAPVDSTHDPLRKPVITQRWCLWILIVIPHKLWGFWCYIPLHRTYLYVKYTHTQILGIVQLIFFQSKEWVILTWIN